MTRFLSTMGFLACAWCAPALAAEPAASGDGVVLVIDGVKLTMAEIETTHPAGMFQARNTFYEAQKKAVDEYVNEYLLERQAKKEHVTVTELLNRHVNIAAGKDPSDEALRVYYEGIDTPESYDAVRDKIIDAIRQRRIAKAKTAYLQSLRSEASVAVRMSPPRAQISLKDTPIRGRADAPVIVVEYADYECPYCQQIQPAVDKLAADYAGKVAIVFKDTPLPMHANAQKSAEAAHCAGTQGKYWEYHDLLFSSKQLDPAKLKEDARTLKLDGAQFDRCLDSGQHAEVVKAQLAEAQSLGLPGTPGFFVNGRFLTGAVSYDILRQIVEEELRASPAKSAVAANGEANR
jgi:protein-disulfide isomerase